MTQPESATRFKVLEMAARDLPAAQALSQAVSWPHRLEDWQFVHALGKGLVAYSDDRLVGTAMWWSHGGILARVGMVIVDPTIQRSGIGRGLTLAILDRISDPTVMLNATAAGETLYRQLGFQAVASLAQHQGTSFAAPLMPLRAGGRIRPMGRKDGARLIELDAIATGARRDAVIAALMGDGDAVVLDEEGEAVGFAFYRRFGCGYVIGPVVARDTMAAKALVAHWIGLNAGMFMRIDVPGVSDLSDWLDELGLARTSHVQTMIRGPAIRQGGEFHTFAAVNQALG